MAKRQRRDRGQWQAIIAGQERSGQSAKAYCKKKGVGLASFYQWRKRLAVEIGPARNRGDREFIELEQSRHSEKSARERRAFEAIVDLGEGITMTFRRG